MPTDDPITTDRLAAAIRTGMATQPLLTTQARPVADRLAMLIRNRLPNIPASDTGEVMIHLAAFLSDVMAALTEEGESTANAVLIATSAIAMTGVVLHESDENRYDSRDAADAAARLRAWFKAEGPLVMDEEDLDDVQTVLAAYERVVTAQAAVKATS